MWCAPPLSFHTIKFPSIVHTNMHTKNFPWFSSPSESEHHLFVSLSYQHADILRLKMSLVLENLTSFAQEKLQFTHPLYALLIRKLACFGHRVILSVLFCFRKRLMMLTGHRKNGRTTLWRTRTLTQWKKGKTRQCQRYKHVLMSHGTYVDAVCVVAPHPKRLFISFFRV